MDMKALCLLLSLCLCSLFISCSGSGGGGGESAELFRSSATEGGGGDTNGARRKSLESRFATTYADARTADGKPAKISSFNNREAYTGKNQFNKKEFRRDGYQKKEWSGARDAQVKSFTKNDASKRFLTENRDAQKNAREFGQDSRFGSQQYKTSQYATDAAREGRFGSDRVSAKKRSSYVGSRRDNLPDPTIMSLRDAQLKNMAETRSIMGRDQ